MLAAFDAVFLVFTLTLFCISAWSTSYNDFVRPWLTPYFLPGNHMIQEIWLYIKNIDIIDTIDKFI